MFIGLIFKKNHMATLDINYVHVHLQKSNNILDSMNNLHFTNSPSAMLTANNTSRNELLSWAYGFEDIENVTGRKWHSHNDVISALLYHLLAFLNIAPMRNVYPTSMRNDVTVG